MNSKLIPSTACIMWLLLVCSFYCISGFMFIFCVSSVDFTEAAPGLNRKCLSSVAFMGSLSDNLSPTLMSFTSQCFPMGVLTNLTLNQRTPTRSLHIIKSGIRMTQIFLYNFLILLWHGRNLIV